MRVIFKVDVNNEVTILSADQDETLIIVKQEDNEKIITVTAPEPSMDLLNQDYSEGTY